MKAQKRHAIVIVNMKYYHMLLGFFFFTLHNPLVVNRFRVAHDSFNSEDLVNVTLLDAFLFLLLVVKHIHVILSDLINHFLNIHITCDNM